MTHWTADAPTGPHTGAAVRGMSSDITLDGVTSDVSAETMSGEVTLRLPADSDAQMHLHSTSGGVRTEFETLQTVKAPASHTVSGNVGAGTGSVPVTTMSGTVTLLRRAAVNTRGDDPPYSPVAGMESKTQ